MRTLLHLGAAVAVAVIPAAASLAANAHWPDQPPHQMAHLGELKLEGGGVICSDALGATQIGYEHSTSPTNSGLKMKFPQYHQRDMVKAQYLSAPPTSEDTLRFHALRLRDVGMIKSTPQKLIAQGTDWRFLNELKEELKT